MNVAQAKMARFLSNLSRLKNVPRFDTPRFKSKRINHSPYYTKNEKKYFDTMHCPFTHAHFCAKPESERI